MSFNDVIVVHAIEYHHACHVVISIKCWSNENKCPVLNKSLPCLKTAPGANHLFLIPNPKHAGNLSTISSICSFEEDKRLMCLLS